MQWLGFLLLVLLIVFAGLKFHALYAARSRLGGPEQPLSTVFPDGVAVRPKMLLYFYSEHCAACRAVTPLIEALHKREEGVVKLDVRRHLMTARHFGIKTTPSLVLLERGRVADIHVGAINQATLQQFYEGRGRH